MRTLALGAAFVALLAGGVAGQTTETKSETKIKVKDGKDVTITGCLATTEGTPGFMLTNVDMRKDDADRDARTTTSSYMLVGKADDLRKHVGHMIEVKGKAVDREDGELEVTTKTEVEQEDAEDRETETRSEIKGDLAGLPFLGVKSVKMIRATCS